MENRNKFMISLMKIYDIDSVMIDFQDVPTTQKPLL